MSSYLYLGQIKRGIDRGTLLNQALGRIHDAPNKYRKDKVLDGLEVAEAVTIMGLADAVKGLFVMYRELYERDAEQGKAAMRRGLYDQLIEQFPRTGQHSTLASPTQAPPTPAERPAASPQPLARPLAPAPEPAAESASPAPVQSPQPKQADEVEDSEPAGAGRSILSGMMSLRTNTNT